MEVATNDGLAATRAQCFTVQCLPLQCFRIQDDHLAPPGPPAGGHRRPGGSPHRPAPGGRSGSGPGRCILSCGQVTASIQQPTGGLGYWPAFWMLGPGQWPENGEIDIMEDVNALSELSGTVHCGTDPGGPCNEPNGIGSGLRSCSGCQTGYNTYTMILNRTNTSAESITI